MTRYWTEYRDGSLSEKYESIGSFNIIRDNTDNYFAQGENINFNNFFGINRPNISNCTVTDSIINDCILECYGNITGYKNNITFKNCKINSLKISKLRIPKISLINCVIKNLEIQQSDHIKSLYINNLCRIDNISFNKNSFVELFEIQNSEINEIISNNDSTVSSIKIIQSNINFLSILKNKILKVFIIEDCVIKNTLVEYTSFEDIFKFNRNEGITFNVHLSSFKNDSLNISNSDFPIIFNSIKFNNRISLKLDSSKSVYLTFSNCYFSQETSFKGKILNPTQSLKIENTVFKDLTLFEEIFAKCLVIKEVLFQNGISIPINEINIKTEVNSSVWCIFKNQALSRKDNISALEYKSYEMNSYSKELYYSKNKNQEKIVLFLNKISNNHGLNWGRGLLFTIIVWLFFYTIFYLSVNNFNLCLNIKNCSFIYFQKTYWSEAISYLWIAHGLSELSEGLKNSNNWIFSFLMTVSYLLGKIFIAYGIFQSISAFRKHGKL